MKLWLYSVAIILSLFFCTASAIDSNLNYPVREFVVDTDGDVDDIIALSYLLQRRDIKIRAILIESNGAAHCKPAFTTIIGLLRLTHHLEVPVACGIKTPAYSRHQFTPKFRHLVDTFSYMLLHHSRMLFSHQTAKELLIKTLRASNKPVDLLVLGPMTSLANALQQHPEIKNKIRKIYAMGGAIYVPGNIDEREKNNKVAEWNIYLDPYSAKIVFHSGIPIVLIPLDITNQVPMTKEFYMQLKHRHVTPVAKFVFQLFNQRKQYMLTHHWYFWDPLAAVIAINNNIANCKILPLTVKLIPETQSGATVVNQQYGSPIQVCLKINEKKFQSVFLQGLNS